jgi:hypothetical protein
MAQQPKMLLHGILRLATWFVAERSHCSSIDRTLTFIGICDYRQTFGIARVSILGTLRQSLAIDAFVKLVVAPELYDTSLISISLWRISQVSLLENTQLHLQQHPALIGLRRLSF